MQSCVVAAGTKLFWRVAKAWVEHLALPRLRVPKPSWEHDMSKTSLLAEREYIAILQLLPSLISTKMSQSLGSFDAVAYAKEVIEELATQRAEKDAPAVVEPPVEPPVVDNPVVESPPEVDVPVEADPVEVEPNDPAD